jgi:hypothetical protein
MLMCSVAPLVLLLLVLLLLLLRPAVGLHPV